MSNWGKVQLEVEVEGGAIGRRLGAKNEQEIKIEHGGAEGYKVPNFRFGTDLTLGCTTQQRAMDGISINRLVSGLGGCHKPLHNSMHRIYSSTTFPVH